MSEPKTKSKATHRLLNHPAWPSPLPLYQSSLLASYTDRLIHGFTGKPVSFGGEPEDQNTTIAKNRQTLCEAMGLDVDQLIAPSQTHSGTVKPHTAASFEETDGILVTEPGVPVMVQTADCVPIMLYDPVQHVGAVVHAGWRGTAQGIIQNAVRLMTAQSGSDPQDVIAVIGPSASVCCYEVSEEVRNALAETVEMGLDEAKTTIAVINDVGKPQVDLKETNALQLQGLGVTAVDLLAECTICTTGALWSYRRGENARQVAILALL